MMLPRFRTGLLLRLTLVVDLLVYTLGVMLFALLPVFPSQIGFTNTLEPIEVIWACLGIPVGTLLVSRLFEHPLLPAASRFAYSIAAIYYLSTIILLWSLSRSDLIITVQAKIVVFTFLLSGVVGAAFGHIMDGGPEPANTRRMEKLLRDVRRTDAR